MPYLLRKIKKSRWYQPSLPWLANNEIPADPLADLQTTDNSLSVWMIEDDKANLQQVLAAIAANRDHLANVDYAIIKDELVPQLIKREQTRGKTVDDSANDSFHLEFKEVSASKLLDLAKAIFDHGEKKRILSKDVGKLIKKAVQEGKIAEAKLTDSIKKKIFERR